MTRSSNAVENCDNAKCSSTQQSTHLEKEMQIINKDIKLYDVDDDHIKERLADIRIDRMQFLPSVQGRGYTKAAL